MTQSGLLRECLPLTQVVPTPVITDVAWLLPGLACGLRKSLPAVSLRLNELLYAIESTNEFVGLSGRKKKKRS